MQLPDSLDADMTEILGRPNFWCGPIAESMRADGAVIRRRSEDEQAAVLFKLLGFYAEHGANWRDHAVDWMQAMSDRLKKAREAAPPA